VAVLSPSPAAADDVFTPCASNGTVCATLTVPLDYTGATPGQLALHVEQLPAPEPARGVLLLLAGGPGQPSAGTFALGSRGSEWQALFPGYTLVTYDDRGTGESGALDCSTATAGEDDFAALVGACLGPNRVFYTTRDHAEDIESIRLAVGADKLALFGGSYGTKQAVAYALAHPDHVERLVLDSDVLPEGDPLGLLSLRAIPAAIASICSGGSCRSISKSPARDFATLANRLQAHPLRVGGNFRLDGVTLLDLAYASDLDPSVASELPAATAAALAGWAEPLGRLLVLDSLWQRRLGPIDQELLIATDCGDGPFPWQSTDPPETRQAALDAAVVALPPGSLGPFGSWATNVGLAALCRSWPAPSGTPLAPGPLPDVPVLVLSGDRDIRTPTAGAAAMAARFPQGHLLVVPGLGHSVLRRSQCAADALRVWLDGAVPPAACPRVPLAVPPVGPFRRTLAATPAPRAAGLPGRTLAAALVTLREAEATWLFAGPGLKFLPAVVTGGLAARGAATFALQDYCDTPGVKLSGTVVVELAGELPATPLRIRSASSDDRRHGRCARHAPDPGQPRDRPPRRARRRNAVLTGSVLAAGDGEAEAETDQGETAGAAEELEPARRACEPEPRRPRGEGPAAVGDECDCDAHGPEHGELKLDVPGPPVDELRQYRREDDQRLRVRRADDEALAEDAPPRLGHRGGVQQSGERPAVPQHPQAEHDEVRGAGELQQREQEDRPREERPQTERDERDLDGEAARVPDHRGECGPAPEGHAPADDEQHARARHCDQHEHRQQEREHVDVRHGPNVPALSRERDLAETARLIGVEPARLRRRPCEQLAGDDGEHGCEERLPWPRNGEDVVGAGNAVGRVAARDERGARLADACRGLDDRRQRQVVGRDGPNGEQPVEGGDRAVREVGRGQRLRSDLAGLEELQRDLARRAELDAAADHEHPSGKREGARDGHDPLLEIRDRLCDLRGGRAQAVRHRAALTRGVTCQQGEGGDLVQVRLRGRDGPLHARSEGQYRLRLAREL
jgi:pimeloyl-ACP methyl ester carboxylesterase